MDYKIEKIKQLKKLERATFHEEHMIKIKGKDAKILVFKLNGCDINDWKKSKYKLESLFDCIISSIEVAGHYDEYVEITMLDLKYRIKANYDLPDNIESSKDEIVLGEGLFNAVKIDLNKTNNILISGGPGAGKSVLINSIVLQLSKNNHKTILASVGKKNGVPKLEGISDLKYLLDDLKLKIKMRRKLFRRNFVKNIAQYNRKVSESNQVKRLIVIIDEFEMLASDYKFLTTSETIEFENSIKRDFIKLASESVGTGIHFIISTQYRKTSFKYKYIYRDFDTSICGYTYEKDESILAIGSTEAIRMPNVSGRFLIRKNNELEEFQSYYVKRNSIENIKTHIVDIFEEMNTISWMNINSNKENKLKTTIDKIIKKIMGGL